MPTKIFVSLHAKDLDSSKEFFKQPGSSFHQPYAGRSASAIRIESASLNI